MLIPLLGISLFKNCTPYLRKHVISSNCSDCEFIVLNSILVIFFIVAYSYFYKNEQIFQKKINLSYLQIAGLIAGAFITCLTFAKRIEYERDNSIVSVRLLLQSFSFILFILVGYLFFNETFTINQIVGFCLIIAGILVSSF
jgi:uncharacterized membrane protein